MYDAAKQCVYKGKQKNYYSIIDQQTKYKKKKKKRKKLKQKHTQ